MAQVAGFDVGYESDLKDYGYTEDGEKFIGYVYYVTATDAKGNVYARSTHYDGVRVEHNEWGTGFADVRHRAIASCERLIAHIVAAGKIDLSRWRLCRAVYGSEAWEEWGNEEQVAFERG